MVGNLSGATPGMIAPRTGPCTRSQSRNPCSSAADPATWARIAAEGGDKAGKQIISHLAAKLPKEEIVKAEADAKDYLSKKTSDDAAKGVPPVAPPLE